LYDVTTPNQAGITGTSLPFGEGVRAIAFVRFIQDWIARDLLAPPADKMALANRLLVGNPPLPPRGGFTTQGAAGKVDFNGFCKAHASDIAAITDDTSGLGDFVRSSNLPQYFTSFRPVPIMEVHHYFVAELIHEAIGP
jgi:hypothetical protein